MRHNSSAKLHILQYFRFLKSPFSLFEVFFVYGCREQHKEGICVLKKENTDLTRALSKYEEFFFTGLFYL